MLSTNDNTFNDWLIKLNAPWELNTDTSMGMAGLRDDNLGSLTDPDRPDRSLFRNNEKEAADSQFYSNLYSLDCDAGVVSPPHSPHNWFCSPQNDMEPPPLSLEENMTCQLPDLTQDLTLDRIQAHETAGKMGEVTGIPTQRFRTAVHRPAATAGLCKCSKCNQPPQTVNKRRRSKRKLFG